MASSSAVALLYRPLDESIDSASLSVYSYDVQKHKHQFRNKIALQSALRLHALCYDAATSQSPRPSLYSEVANHVSELLKLYKNKVRPSHHAQCVAAYSSMALDFH